MKDRAETIGNGRDEKLKERWLIPIKFEENCPATQLRLCLLPNLATQRFEEWMARSDPLKPGVCI